MTHATQTARKLHISGLKDRERLKRFFVRMRPGGASVLFNARGTTWLLKTDQRGGKTIGRIFVMVEDESVDKMIEEEFDACQAAMKAELAETMAQWDNEEVAA